MTATDDPGPIRAGIAVADPVTSRPGGRAAGRPAHPADAETGRAQTLKRNSTTSPSCITYSLPSMRTLPAALAAAIDPAATRSS